VEWRGRGRPGGRERRRRLDLEEPARPYRSGHRQAWTQWRYVWKRPALGQQVLMARATDAAGRTQPLATPFNDNGYFFDAVVRHPVTVV
jgi:hypothetical protein